MKAGTLVKRWWIPGVIVGLIVIVFIFLLAGFRIGPGLSIVRVGTLVLEDLPPGTSIYVDGTYSQESRGGDARLTLIPGNHTIIVSADDALPWSELVSVSSEAETRISPLLMPSITRATALKDQEATAATALIRTVTLPTAAAPLAREGGCALVSVSGNRIIADATTTPSCVPPEYLCTGDSCGPTVVFAPLETINTLLPFPGREDMVIVSVGQTLFVLELDPREPGYFAPILKGPTPKAALTPEGALVVSSGVHLYQIDL